jgi:hypothetical protein
MKKIIPTIAILVATTASAQMKPTQEKLITDQKGFLTCTGGGSSAPLFSRDCVKINLTRVSSPGSIKYEGSCLDSNETTYLIACDSYTLEYSQIPSGKPKDSGLGD